ncbi:MAG: hypothetical protein K0R73_1181 [Candidatus Midichloriaceae bacterium]|jgi:hypothetical protein|nr:hypothetical protein [Candidatus Midichloriaceae bacterium]
MNSFFFNAIVKQLLQHAIKTFIFVASTFLAQFAIAATTSSSFGDWVYYTHSNQHENLCIIYTKAIKTKGDVKDDKLPAYLYLMKKGHNQFSLGMSPGFAQDPNKEVLLKFNNRSYALKVGLPNYSWSHSSIEDVSLINEMLMGGKFLTSHSYALDDAGGAALDYYSLKGFAPALKKLDKCVK